MGITDRNTYIQSIQVAKHQFSWFVAAADHFLISGRHTPAKRLSKVKVMSPWLACHSFVVRIYHLSEDI